MMREYGGIESATLIKIHEVDHINRINAARLDVVLNQKEQGLTFGVPGKASIALEYLANKAALEAAKTMEQTDAVQNTVKEMEEQNDMYLIEWGRFRNN